MARIVKLSQDGSQIYPQTITDAIADVRTRSVLSTLLESYERRLTAIETIIGSGSTSEYIDNLYELLKYFSGVTDMPSFIDVIKKYVEAQDVEDIPSTPEDESSEDYPDFDEMFGNNEVEDVNYP